MQSNETNRREFLTRLGLGAVLVGATSALVACGKTEGGAGAGCDDLTGLSDADKGTRTANGYVGKSTEAGKSCTGCTFFNVPAGGAACGTCKVVKGPIDAAGYCKLFAVKPA